MSNQQQCFVRISGSNQKPMPLFSPVSKQGQCPNFVGGLPDYGPEEKGVFAAVGYPRSYLVYRFHYDDKNQQGSWAFNYSVESGEVVE